MEEISAFLWRESLDDAANSAQQTANGALSCLAQMRLQFAEGHLDGIEVRRVRRQINQCRTHRFDRLSDAGHLVDRQIVHHDNVAALEGRNKILFHISKEQRSIHGAFKDERRGHSALAQGADKGDDFPVPVRRVIDQPLAARIAAPKRTIAVLVHVSSINTSRAGSNMPCWRIQRWRSRITSSRFCSAAYKVFFKGD